MHKPVKYGEKIMTYVARAGWAVFERASSIANRAPLRTKLPKKKLTETKIDAIARELGKYEGKPKPTGLVQALAGRYGVSRRRIYQLAKL